ncbi:SdpI family protein [Clostridium gasigenes]|uniref:SdpI family protein n=1 Tax=Clostridium gasigenes TaxID=94869 RepID=A0A7X0SHI6_9CLOT|nr:SdpI family protein [Clostridium gasigenes]MBB6716497.1 SdpI family protein [Clostridium gasigenes]
MGSIENLIPYLCIPIIYLIIGIILKYAKVKKINGFVGYRTNSSTLSQENWDKANSYFPNIMIKAGIIMVILGIILYLIFPSSEVIIMTYLLGSPFVSIFYIIRSTEKYIKS